MRFSVAIDIGGTFTDCLVDDRDSVRHIFKASSTPAAFERGFMESLRLAAEFFELTLPEFLRLTGRIIHGSTVSTNALVEGKVAKTGFFCTAGHPDILTLREAPRKPTFSWRQDYPPPYIPRARTVEIGGRISATGVEISPLAEHDIHAGVARLKNSGIEALGLCFLWSIANPAHELRASEIIRETWPGIPVTLSHQLNPVGREYRRAIGAVIDASITKVVGDYISVLREALDAAGFKNELLLTNCVGGMMPPDALLAKPIYSVMSGPTLAPVAAMELSDKADIIVTDMGGTTFDVSAIRDRRLIINQDGMIGHDLLGVPKVDVRSVGAGGGSIAAVNKGGMLKVGPHSAGAMPGPACYGRGGTQPTVTDANLVLGILDADYFLGGRMRLDHEAAARAILPIAQSLGVSVMQAAYAIYTTGNNVMADAIIDLTVKEGINPRESFLIVGGGATAAHIGEIARALGIKELLIPRFAAGLSAYGGLISDVRWEEQAAVFTTSARFDPEPVNQALTRLSAHGRDFLQKAQVAAADARLEYAFLGRYCYQSWEIEVPLHFDEAGIANAVTLARAFHQMHERIYGVKAEADVVEFTGWKVRAIGTLPRHDPAVTRPAGAAISSHTRKVYIHDLGGLVDCPVFRGHLMGAGASIEGPAIIEEPTTTILLLPGMTARADAAGNYSITLA